MIQLATPVGDAYRDVLLPDGAALRRFTAYIRFDPDPDGIEEIDVDAVGPRHAREIVEAALARDYDPGGKIESIEERHGPPRRRHRPGGTPMIDPHTCPFCRANDGPFQELADRFTWQPVRLDLDAAGHLETGDYGSFDYGDDVRVTGYQCSSCQHTWETLAALERDQRIVAAFTDAMERLETVDAEPDLEPVEVARYQTWELALEIFRADGDLPDPNPVPRTLAQNRAYHRMVAAVANLRGISLELVKAETLAWASTLVGREVTTSKALTEVEMGKVLDWLDDNIKSAIGALA